MTAGQSATPTTRSWCKCEPSRPYRPNGRRIFTVVDRYNKRSMLEVAEYCLRCKGVLVPTGTRLQVTDADGEDALLRARASAVGAPGRGQTHGALLGVDWITLISCLELPRVRVQQLYSGWNAHKFPNKVVRESMYALVGLSPTVKSALVHTPVGPVSIDHATAEHPLTLASRYDADHCSYFALTKTTLEKPVEVWRVAATADRPKRLRFLGAYVIGLTVTTHVAIVDDATRRVITAYRLDAHETRGEKKRQGEISYRGW